MAIIIPFPTQRKRRARAGIAHIKRSDPERYLGCLATLRTYARTPVADRPSYGTFATLIGRWYGLSMTPEGLRKLLKRHFC